MAAKKMVRIGDDPEFQKAFRAVARKVLGRGPSKFPFRCQRCLDRGYVMVEGSGGGRKWTTAAACSGQVMDAAVGMFVRCTAADKPVFMARITKEQPRDPPKFANMDDTARGKRSEPKQDAASPAAAQQPAAPVYRNLSLRNVLPSEMEVASWKSEIVALFPQGELDAGEPARRIEVSERAVDNVIAQVDELISEGEDEASQIDVMIDLINEDW